MKLLKHKEILILVVINILLVISCASGKGTGTFIALPIDFIINLTFVIYSIIKKKEKLIITSLLIMFAAPIIGIIIFAINFPWIAH